MEPEFAGVCEVTNRVFHVFDVLKTTGRSYREPLYDCRNHEIHLWRILPGDWIYPHTHPATDDIWYVARGQGDYYLTAVEKQTVSEGCLLLASPNEIHGLYNSSDEDLVIISVLAPLPVTYNEAPGFEYPH